MRRSIKLLLIIATVVFVIIVAILISLFVGISGGKNKALVETGLGPKAEKLDAERTTAIKLLITEQEALLNKKTFTFYDKSTHDVCYKGQHNFKIKSPFAYKCVYKMTYYYGFGDDLKTKMLNVEKEIDNQGWTPFGNNRISNILSEYFDRYYGPTKPKPEAFPHYMVSDMPPAIYTKSDVEHRLEIFFAERGTTTNNASQIVYLQETLNRGLVSQRQYESKNFLDAKRLIDEITSKNKFVLVVTMEKVYYSY